MDLTEKQVSFDYKYEGRIIKIRCDKAQAPSGNIVDREVCEHPGGVAVLPIHEDGTVTLVQQYRYPFGCALWEIPAGKLEKGEQDPEACGRRELAEEAGLQAGRMVFLGTIYPSPGFLNEIIYLFAALELTACEAHPDEDENIITERLPFTQCRQRIAQGDIVDAKTIAAFYRAELVAE